MPANAAQPKPCVKFYKGSVRQHVDTIQEHLHVEQCWSTVRSEKVVSRLLLEVIAQGGEHVIALPFNTHLVGL